MFESMWNGILALFIQVSLSCLEINQHFINLIMDIAKIDFFNKEMIDGLLGRIYIVLGIIILFKIIVSFVQFLINPDKSDDKESGFGGIAKRTFLSICLLMLLPAIFNFSKEIQVTVVKYLPAIILGNQPNSFNSEKVGLDVVNTTAKAFLIYADNGCNDGSLDKISASIATMKNNSAKIVTETCSSSPTGKRYSFNYLCIVVGIFLLWVLISMSLDVGMRVIKMGILEILAPIAVASYIDPQTSKKSFSVWVQQCISVYTDLFIRLGVIYFVLLFFQSIPSIVSNITSTIPNISILRQTYIKLAIIVSLFLFAKNAPQFICEILGIKVNGSIGDMFKRAWGLSSLPAAGWNAARSNFTTQRERLKSQNKKAAALRAALSAAAGAGSAMARDAKMVTFDKKGFREAKESSFRTAINKRNARNDLYDNVINKEEGYKYMNYRHDLKREKLGIPSNQDFTIARHDSFEEQAKLIGSAKGHGATKMNETPNLYKIGLNKGNRDEKTIADATGFEELSMEQVRNMYALARGGQDIENKQGQKIHLNDEQLESLGNLVQTIEKRTAYLKEADLMSSGDPGASDFLEKLKFKIKSDKTLYNDPEIMDIISRKMQKRVDGANIKSFEDFYKYVSTMGNEIITTEHIKPIKPTNYDKNSEAREKYDKDFQLWQDEWRKKVSERANILIGIKDSLEEVEKQMLPDAQQAQMRLQKAQQARKNANDKKGS